MKQLPILHPNLRRHLDILPSRDRSELSESPLRQRGTASQSEIPTPQLQIYFVPLITRKYHIWKPEARDQRNFFEEGGVVVDEIRYRSMENPNVDGEVIRSRRLLNGRKATSDDVLVEGREGRLVSGDEDWHPRLLNHWLGGENSDLTDFENGTTERTSKALPSSSCRQHLFADFVFVADDVGRGTVEGAGVRTGTDGAVGEVAFLVEGGVGRGETRSSDFETPILDDSADEEDLILNVVLAQLDEESSHLSETICLSSWNSFRAENDAEIEQKSAPTKFIRAVEVKRDSPVLLANESTLILVEEREIELASFHRIRRIRDKRT